MMPCSPSLPHASIYLILHCQTVLFITFGLAFSSGVSGGGGANPEFVHEQITTPSIVGTYKVKGKIKDCITGKGIANVSVIYTNGQSTETNIDGDYEIIAHGDIDRIDSLVISNGNNACIKVNCSPDGCDSTFDLIPISAPACGTPRIVTVPDMLMTLTENTTTRGLMIGRYGAGIVLEDCISRETFVQSNDNSYIDITDMENTSVISFDITQLKVPAKFKALSFYVTENLLIIKRRQIHNKSIRTII